MDALTIPAAGGKDTSAIILGGGVIGVEFASVFARLGSKVTLVELMDTLLPIEDTAVGEELAKIGIRVPQATDLAIALSKSGAKNLPVTTGDAIEWLEARA